MPHSPRLGWAFWWQGGYSVPGMGKRHTGWYSPLRYPGGKGKLARFIAEVVADAGLAGGRYIEPYAGGAAVAWELLATGVVNRVVVNDLSPHIHAFWRSVLDHPEELVRRVFDTPLTIEEWHRQREVVLYHEGAASTLDLGFATFYLNRTNRSGILKAGVIGGQRQDGDYRMDARYNREDLVARIREIACRRSQIKVANQDALGFLQQEEFSGSDLLYVDPPYFEKSRQLYHDTYELQDHERLAEALRGMGTLNWIVSYDDVEIIRKLYGFARRLEYDLPYSASLHVRRGSEVMFFSPGLSRRLPLGFAVGRDQKGNQGVPRGLQGIGGRRAELVVGEVA